MRAIPFLLSNLLPTVSTGVINHLAGMESPTSPPLVRGVVEGAQRKLARPVQLKQPLLTGHRRVNLFTFARGFLG